ncbi:MAG: 2-amino-4-hydroxy-6-hydroxymethyldihydropteridine diphosphokinase [Pseudomonadota bacterium]
MRFDNLVVLGLGSNLGNSATVLADACTRLAGFARGAVLRSSCFRTSPVDCPPGSASFLNAVVALEPRFGLTPERLLYRLKSLERQFGREQNPVRHAPRELDIDLLLFGDQRVASERLVLPHPRAVERRFVLAPLVQILPELVWPDTGRTVAKLLDELHGDERVERLALAGWP